MKRRELPLSKHSNKSLTSAKSVIIFETFSELLCKNNFFFFFFSELARPQQTTPGNVDTDPSASDDPFCHTHRARWGTTPGQGGTLPKGLISTTSRFANQHSKSKYVNNDYLSKINVPHFYDGLKMDVGYHRKAGRKCHFAI